MAVGNIKLVLHSQTDTRVFGHMLNSYYKLHHQDRHIPKQIKDIKGYSHIKGKEGQEVTAELQANK